MNVRTEIMKEIYKILETKIKYKIGIVCYPTYGGSGVVATELGVSLLKGHEVHFISYSQPFRLDVFCENTFFHEVSVPDYPLFDYTPYELNLTSKAVDVVLHEGLNLLHVHYAIPHAHFSSPKLKYFKNIWFIFNNYYITWD